MVAGPTDKRVQFGIGVAVFALVLVVGVVAFVQQAASTPHGPFGEPQRRGLGPVPGKKVSPRLDSLEYVYGGGFKVIARGYGFTSDWNSYKIKNGHWAEPLRASADGTSVVFRMRAAVTDFVGGPGFNRSGAQPAGCPLGETCPLEVRMVNEDGLTSNNVTFGWHIPDEPVRVVFGPAPDAPGPQTVTPGATDIEVLQYTVKSEERNWDDLQFGDALLLLTSAEPFDCRTTIAGLTVSDGTRRITVPDYGVFAREYPYSDGGQTVPAGACAAVFSVPEDLRSQWDPANLFLIPGQEKTLSFRLSILPTARPGLTFRAYAALAPRGPSPASFIAGAPAADRFGSPVTIAAP